MGDRSDGAFTLVAEGVDGDADRAAVAQAAERAATAMPGGKAGPLQEAGAPAFVRADLDGANDVVYVQIATPLENQDAARLTPDARTAIGEVEGVQTYLWPSGSSTPAASSPRRRSS